MSLLLARAFTNDEVVQLRSEVWGKQGDTETFSCSYSTKLSLPCLFWYRQYPHQGLQYILREPGKSSACSQDMASVTNGRVTSVANSSFTSITIHQLEVEDSAEYYCAVRDAAQWHIASPAMYRNLEVCDLKSRAIKHAEWWCTTVTAMFRNLSM
ncbi:hypothetical protein NDU88_008369 [Pleurodeles waltl]|uniref:Ig-like domain-containing protein n=1 Tax=Pleurodeles waltl TaxID=8319 RepID=A0AAV7SVQ7_PLEWA|nr:hypothetical protein NDU88_008369 [Pleurodeles waltl]